MVMPARIYDGAAKVAENAENQPTACVLCSHNCGLRVDVKDNTIVKFATTVGQITSQSQTIDGLAVAILTSPGDNRPRQAEIVAQAVTVRDTIDVDFIISVQADF